VPRVLREIVDDANAHWLAGEASSDLARAGVVLRVFDGQETAGKPWLPDANSVVGDHFAVTIVSAVHPDVYEGGNGPLSRAPGMMLASSLAVRERISCAYSGDGGSNNKQCRVRGGDDICRPGCAKYWCENGRRWNCAYRPSKLVEALQRQDREHPAGHVRSYGYNEIVLDAWKTPWEQAVPNDILAFWVQPHATAAEKQRARDAHRAYLADPAVAGKPAAATTPLLTYDPLATREPFALFTGG
jgi:hypothetical protein